MINTLIVDKTNCVDDIYSIRNKVISMLLKYGYNFKQKGSIYMLETISYIYQCNNMELLDNLEKNVLKHIAYKNNRTVLNIKTSMIKATNSIGIKNDKYNIQHTPKSIITRILIELFNQNNQC